MTRAVRFCLLLCTAFWMTSAQAATKAVPAADVITSIPTVKPLEHVKITSATKEFSRGFRGELERIVAAHHGVMGLSLKNLDSGEEFDVNGDEVFPTASTIKLTVMCTVFDELTKPNGKFKDYYETRTYDAATSTGGAGFVQNYRDGTKIELKELLHFMITVSDNIATNMVVEWVGIDTINNWLISHGFKTTRMLATIGGRISWNNELRRKWGIGITTPNEMRRLLSMIRKGEAGTTSGTDEMMRLMGHQYFDGDIAAGVPPYTWVGSKSGSVNDSRSDNAIVSSPGGTYVLSVYTKDNEDHGWKYDNEGDRNIRAVSRAVWRHYNPNSKWEPAPGVDKF